MNRPPTYTFFVLLLGSLLAFFPPPAAAATAARQLSVLAAHLDVAMSRLRSGDLRGARSAYEHFDDGWYDMEDGVKARSKTSYRSIENAMGDARYALEAEPFNESKAMAALKKLRSECDAFIAGPPTSAQPTIPSRPRGEVPLALLETHLDRALQKLKAHDPVAAATAVAAFRRDWTDVEGLVKAKSARTYVDTEDNMAKAYALLTAQPPDEAGARQTLKIMQTALLPYAEGETRYGVFDAAVILLREGLEALLVVGALLAFLKKTNNADKQRWIWAGGGAGVAASVAVAVFVNLLFSRATAGVNRELLEGITGLVAAAMLVYVSYWLHSKASLGAWQRYIRDQSSAALARNSLLSLALIAFLAVFREGAETVLFYIGIAPAITTRDLVLGLGLGAGALVLVGLLIFLFGLRLPIRPFFLVTSVLLYYLAFKFVGTGIHSLQVAGVLPVAPADYLPQNGFLGLFPNWESTLVQAALLVAAAAVLLAGRLHGLTHSTPGRPEHASGTD